MTNLSVVGGTSIPAKISGQNLSRDRFTISDPVCVGGAICVPRLFSTL